MHKNGVSDFILDIWFLFTFYAGFQRYFAYHLLKEFKLLSYIVCLSLRFHDCHNANEFPYLLLYNGTAVLRIHCIMR